MRLKDISSEDNFQERIIFGLSKDKLSESDRLLRIRKVYKINPVKLKKVSRFFCKP
jgi:hypothetical protein